MTKDYNDEDYINSLVDRFKETNDDGLRWLLLSSFDPYFRKYASLFTSCSTVDLNNKDTIKFLRMFMSVEDRSSEDSITTAARRVVNYVRGCFKDCTFQDIYDEVVCFFLEQLERYKPMIADHRHDKPRISFTHFIQVNLRYKMGNMLKARGKDALYCAFNLEYDDRLAVVECPEMGINWSNIDLQWVHGITAGDIFKQLDEMERYLLYLKYEDGDERPLSDYDLAKITGLDRMYIRRKMLKIKDRLKELVAVT